MSGAPANGAQQAAAISTLNALRSFAATAVVNVALRASSLRQGTGSQRAVGTRQVRQCCSGSGIEHASLRKPQLTSSQKSSILKSPRFVWIVTDCGVKKGGGMRQLGGGGTFIPN